MSVRGGVAGGGGLCCLSSVPPSGLCWAWGGGGGGGWGVICCCTDKVTTGSGLITGPFDVDWIVGFGDGLGLSRVEIFLQKKKTSPIQIFLVYKSYQNSKILSTES